MSLLFLGLIIALVGLVLWLTAAAPLVGIILLVVGCVLAIVGLLQGRAL